MPSMASVLLYLGLPVLIGICGRNQRFGFWGYFFATLLLTPVVGILLLIASGGGNTRSRAR